MKTLILFLTFQNLLHSPILFKFQTTNLVSPNSGHDQRVTASKACLLCKRQTSVQLDQCNDMEAMRTRGQKWISLHRVARNTQSRAETLYSTSLIFLSFYVNRRSIGRTHKQVREELRANYRQTKIRRKTNATLLRINIPKRWSSKGQETEARKRIDGIFFTFVLPSLNLAQLYVVHA